MITKARTPKPNTRKSPSKPSFLGFGIGLRTVHYQSILKDWPAIDWFEVVSENFMLAGGRPLYVLDKIRERYPVVMHGVSLSIGSVDPLGRGYLKALKSLAKRVQPRWISDHLCWTGVDGHNAHDLLPLPYTEEAVHHVARRVRQVQDELGQPIALENVSSYLTYRQSMMTEWEFLSAVTEESGCGILLDINNIFVSAFNHEFDAMSYIEGVPADRVWQFHLAGHRNKGTHLLDTHDHPIRPEVWRLYEKALERFGSVSTLIEWDDHIPSLGEMLIPVEEAKKRYATIINRPSKNPKASVEVNHRASA